MLAVVWTDEALRDFQRLILFQLAHNGEDAAKDLAMGLFNFVDGLPFNPRVWRQFKQFDGDVRRGLWSRYEIRYEINDDMSELRILRFSVVHETTLAGVRLDRRRTVPHYDHDYSGTWLSPANELARLPRTAKAKARRPGSHPGS